MSLSVEEQSGLRTLQISREEVSFFPIFRDGDYIMLTVYRRSAGVELP